MIDHNLKTSSIAWFITVLAALLLTGCARYQAAPLPDESPLMADLQHIKPGLDSESSAPLARHPISPADGLDLTEVAIISVLNNPGLRARRARQQVAGAQLFATGLLPDPQLNANLDIPSVNTTGTVNGWGIDLGYDIIPLITRQARIDAAREQEQQVNLNILWQEWRVMQQACGLAVRSNLELQKLALVQATQEIYRKRYEYSTRALNKGDLTLDRNGTDLTALLGIFSQLKDLELAHNETRHHLNLLLGLKPELIVHCTIPEHPVLLSQETARRQSVNLQNRRPDLLALQAGYLSQEARVRAAVLNQFPSVSIGITRAEDTGSLTTTGFGVSLNLPLFSGSRGAIAVERASRKQLKLEYQSRLSQAIIDADRLIQLQDILSKQQLRLEQFVPRLQVIVTQTKKAYNHNDIDALTFFNMEYTWLLKRLEELDLQQAQWDNSLALQAVLALPCTHNLPSPALPQQNSTVSKSQK